jgi:uncharacterized protein (TIGR00304 family)
MVSLVRLVQLAGPAVLIVGLATLALAVARGEASLYLIVVIPAVVGTGPVAFLGILLVFAGFFLTSFLWSIGAPRPAPEPDQVPAVTPPAAPSTRRWGGIVFLGPIPLVFGSDPQMTRMMLVLGVILFLALLGLTIALFFA